MPSPPPQLGFHDCLRYESGGGGCDGCINWRWGRFFSSREVELQWGWVQTEERNSSSAELGADMEAVPDHQQDGQQQDADVGEVVGADLHGDRLASNGAPAGGQS